MLHLYISVQQPNQCQADITRFQQTCHASFAVYHALTATYQANLAYMCANISLKVKEKVNSITIFIDIRIHIPAKIAPSLYPSKIEHDLP